MARSLQMQQVKEDVKRWLNQVALSRPFPNLAHPHPRPHPPTHTSVCHPSSSVPACEVFGQITCAFPSPCHAECDESTRMHRQAIHCPLVPLHQLEVLPALGAVPDGDAAISAAAEEMAGLACCGWCEEGQCRDCTLPGGQEESHVPFTLWVCTRIGVCRAVHGLGRVSSMSSYSRSPSACMLESCTLRRQS